MKNLLTILLLSTLILTSCKKLEVDPIEKETPTTMDKLAAPSTFDWKTSKDFTFTLKGKNNGMVQILSEDGTVYFKGILQGGKDLVATVNIPTFEKNVHLVYWGNDISIALNGSTINYTFPEL